MEAWGWRVPFFVGFLIGPIGIYLRFRLRESPEFLRNEAARTGLARAPILAVLAEHKRRVLIGFGLMAAGTASVYVLFIFMPTYAVRVLGLKLQTALLVPLVAGLTVSIICPIAGHLSDRFGRKRLLAASSLFLLVTLLPAFQWLHSEPSGARLVAVEILVALATGFYAGPLGTAIAELFPVGVRVTAMSVAYNLGVAFFGGFAPLVVAWLIAATGDALAPAHYVMAALLVSLAAIVAMPKRVLQP
jgi:MHS family proline/betaine transporter-like MFS transporter